MSRRAQGPNRSRARPLRHSSSRALLAFVSLALAGCAGNLDIGRLATDSSITTGAVASRPESAPDHEMGSDEQAIALAITEAGSAPPEERGIAWKNAETDAHGTITGMLGYTREDGAHCRRFTATRARFDGIGLYRGEACRETGGAWYVRRLESL